MLTILRNPLYWLALLNLLSFGYGLASVGNAAQKQRFFRLPGWLQKAYVFINTGSAWALAIAPQDRLHLTAITSAVGCACMLAAALVWFLALSQIGLIPSIKPRERVISTGIYGVIRHPIYLGNLLFPTGLALASEASLALLYLPFLAILYATLAVVEETSLLDEYGEDYRSYQKRVQNRLIPLIF